MFKIKNITDDSLLDGNIMFNQIFPISPGILHIVGIGGMAMSAIAKILNANNISVQGSDIAKSENTDSLTRLGIKVFIGHKENNVDNVDTIIKSNAISDNNVEIITALNQKIKVITRLDILHIIAMSYHVASVVGAHGKTTTTNILGEVWTAAGLRPNIFNGGIMQKYGTNCIISDSKWLILEADESDGTFMHIPSSFAILTNIDREHLSHYGSFRKLKESFLCFLNNMPFYGCVSACFDDPIVKKLLESSECNHISYGIDEKNVDLRATNIKMTEHNVMQFTLHLSDKLSRYNHNNCIVNNVCLSLVGRHNVLNALGVIGLSLINNININIIMQALSDIPSVKRRFNTIFNNNKIMVVDDYAHHPKEIISTIDAAKELSSCRKVIAVIQPHTFTRLQENFKAFAKSLLCADLTILLDVDSAHESIIENINSNELHRSLKGRGSVKYVSNNEIGDIYNILKYQLKEGTVVLFMGAGSVTNIAKSFANTLNTELV